MSGRYLCYKVLIKEERQVYEVEARDVDYPLFQGFLCSSFMLLNKRKNVTERNILETVNFE